MEKKKRITKNFRFTEDIINRLMEIKEKRCLVRDIDAVVYAIIETHDREVNNYREIMKNRPAKVVLDPLEKLENQTKRNKEKQDLKMALMIKTARGLCSALEGNEINNGNGTFGCEYQMYEKVGKRVLSGKRIVPYDLLTDEHVVLQYKGGSKEEIKEILSKK